MCGIIGIISNENTSKKIYNSLISLQHRGQDSVGIATIYNNKILIQKRKGTVTQNFNNEQFLKLKGNIGIGHVRYTTTGTCTRKNAQPFFTTLPLNIAMASNGNTINYKELKNWLWEKNISLQSECDLEGLTHVFSLLLKQEIQNNTNTTKPTNQNVFDATQKFMNKVRGSYSIVGIIEGIGLIAFRDQKGIKPLVIGKKNKVNKNENEYTVASETVAFDAINFEFFDNVKPGELIIINPKTGIERKTLVKDKHAYCMFEYIYFARPDSDINGKSVYKTRQELGVQLAEQWITKQKVENLKVDIVIAAPDTSRTAALAFAEKIQIPYREGLIKNRYIGRTFIMPTQDEREGAVNLKINTLKHEVENKHIIIVDDSIVRGTTSKKLITKLRKANTKNIHMISTCSKIKYPCIYGIDMPTSKELIASNKNEKEIAKHIGADTVIYQTIDGLKKSIGCQTLCTACLDGNYPVKMNATTIEEMSKTRTQEIMQTINENKNQQLKILIIGNSAREHIITETLKKSNTNPEIYSFMNTLNPGIAKISKETKIGKLDDISAIIEFAKHTDPEFAFIGPELPISIGIADELEKIGIPSIGPKQQLGQIETSKAFTRQLLKKYNIVGSPKFKVFELTNNSIELLQKLEQFIQSLQDTGFVIKPDGLTGGKGVKVQGEHFQTISEGIEYCNQIFQDGNKVIIEEKLVGEEFSLQSFVDGKTVIDMPPIQDHKRAFENDTGPNTGGMGAYNDAMKTLPFITQEHIAQAHEITVQVNKALCAETGQLYKGIMYGGFIVTKNKVKLIEYNARFGDPEAMNVLSLLETDFVTICRAIIKTKLKNIQINFSNKATVCKYIVPAEYPKNTLSREEVDISQIINNQNELGIKVYFASVNQEQNHLFMSNSRALAIIGIGDTINQAQEKAEQACVKVKGNVRYRSDIGTKQLILKKINHMKEIAE